MPQSKLAYQEGEGVRRGRRSRPQSRPTAPPPSQKLLLQHQQNRKRASALELRLKKRVKWILLDLDAEVKISNGFQGLDGLDQKQVVTNYFYFYFSSVWKMY